MFPFGWTLEGSGLPWTCYKFLRNERICHGLLANLDKFHANDPSDFFLGSQDLILTLWRLKFPQLPKRPADGKTLTAGILRSSFQPSRGSA